MKIMQPVVSIILLLSIGCAPETPAPFEPPTATLEDLPGAENQFYTTDQRLFVSSSEGLWEVVDGDALSFVGMQDCGVNGITQYQDWLVAACNIEDSDDVALYAGALSGAGNPDMQEIFRYSGINIINGILALNDGTLFIADFNPFALGKLARASLVDGGGSLTVQGIEDPYLGPADNVNDPNGLKQIGSYLYFTDYIATTGITRLSRMTISGSDLSALEVVFEKEGVFDDFAPYCDGFILTNFLIGSLTFLDDSFSVLEGDEGVFSLSSSVLQNQAGFFPGSDISVTQRGDIFNGTGGALVPVSLTPAQQSFLCGG